MFEDIYNAVSFLVSWRWPKAEGKATAVYVERAGNRQDQLRLAIAYEFYIGDDGPYTGESFWSPAFFVNRRVLAARRSIRKGQLVEVRYRKDDPSINRLDGNVWKSLAGDSPSSRKAGLASLTKTSNRSRKMFRFGSGDAAAFALYFGFMFLICRFDINKHGRSFQHPIPSAKAACIALAFAAVLTGWLKLQNYLR